MIKAVLDTNTLVSALLKPEGPSGQIFQRWRTGEFELAVSTATLSELSEVLYRPRIIKKYPVSEQDIRRHLDVLSRFAEVAPGALALDVVKNDPLDNHVLAAAVETKSAYAVSGDHHLLDMVEFQGIKILRPREFLSLLEAIVSADR